jgi:hypothetical protein
MQIDFTTTAMCRPELFRRTLESFDQNLAGISLRDCSLYLNIDPLPDNDLAVEVIGVATEYFN